MQGRQAGCLCVLLCLWSGCATKGTPSTQPSWYSRFQPLSVNEERKGQIEIAMVQVPREDALKTVANTSGLELASLNQIIISHAETYLAEGVWKDVDEQVVPLETKPKLEANGFRVGVIRNTLPAKLQQLLGATQSCPQMRRLTAKADHEWFWPLGTESGTASLQLTQEGGPENRQLDQPEFGMLIQASPLPEGKTRFLMTPHLRHGSQTFQAKPNRERTGWDVNTDRPEEKFGKLSWEVVLKPNEYLVIGGWGSRTNSLGRHSFVEAQTGRHRLLVLRGIPATEPLAAGLEGKGPMPLALQSLMPSRQDSRKPVAREVRGQSP